MNISPIKFYTIREVLYHNSQECWWTCKKTSSYMRTKVESMPLNGCTKIYEDFLSICQEFGVVDED